MQILEFLFVFLVEILVAFGQLGEFFLHTINFSFEHIKSLLLLLEAVVCLGNEIADGLSNFVGLIIHHLFYHIYQWYFDLLFYEIELLPLLFVESIVLKCWLVIDWILVSALLLKFILLLAASHLQIVFVIEFWFFLQLYRQILWNLLPLCHACFFIELTCKDTLSELSTHVVIFGCGILVVVFVDGGATWEGSFSVVFGRCPWTFDFFVKSFG